MGELVSLDFTRPSTQDLALAVACMRAHAKTLRRVMMASTTADAAVLRLQNTRHIEEAARRLEMAISAQHQRAEPR
jgi:hypothetical protein